MQEIVNLLIKNNLKIATAESCTGGMIAQIITSFSGASKCYEMGFVTYSNDAKMQMLSVKEETLTRFGAVSEETAREMSCGAKGTSGADMAISVTGIAGPTGGTEQTPVGLVFISVAGNFGTEAEKLNLSGNRDEIRQQAAEKAISMALKYIMKFYS